MKVTVVDRCAMRSDWGNPGLYHVILTTVEISNICPKCGGVRGTPKKRSFYEGGQSYSVDCWDNPCGHIDFYDDVINESMATPKHD